MDLLPHTLKFCLLIVCGLAPAFSQDQPAISPPPVIQPPEAEAPGTIQGTVLSGATGRTLRRAQLVLKPADSKGTALYQTTDDSGAFTFPSVAPGRYVITVQRDGYLPLSSGHIGEYKMPPIFSVSSGQTIDSFVFRMTPQGVVTGKVKFDDAEPAVERGRPALSLLLRSRASRLCNGSQRAHRRSRRIPRAWPGTGHLLRRCFVSSATSAARRRGTDPHRCVGNPLPELSYAVTFFPQVQKMSDAVPVKVAPGDEVGGIDIFLTLVHTVHIRGRVFSAVKGGVVANPSVTLRWNDPDNTASVSAPIKSKWIKIKTSKYKASPPAPICYWHGRRGGVGADGPHAYQHRRCGRRECRSCHRPPKPLDWKSSHG